MPPRRLPPLSISRASTVSIWRAGELRTSSREHALEPAQMALQFVLTRPFVTSAIIGATTMDQLRSHLAARHVKLSPEVLRAIDEINLIYTYPCP